jgi:hypothetical protein
MKTPHKHAELIKAWADGHQIQYRHNGQMEWTSIGDYSPEWSLNTEYRIKPEPKPDVVEFAYAQNKVNGVSISWHTSGCDARNLRLIFDGETGKLKAAEVLK